MARTVMIQGCTSDAGKSTLVAGLCRVLARRGVRVAPFKPQNMALNSAVTEDGGEIGRAQAVQARACGLAPHTDMNPVLLKPNSDTGAQVVIHGRAVANMEAWDYHSYKSTAMAAVLASWDRLCARYDAVVVEGAGSPAEINLRDRDIANMGFAEAVDCPVILIADIDRGGVFAHLVGTLALLSESERARVQGFVINRFRGDLALLEPGLRWLEQETGKPVLGVLPYLHGLHLEAEDALPVGAPSPARTEVAPGLGHSDAAHAFAARTRLLHVGAPSPARTEVAPGCGNDGAAHAFAAGTRLLHVGAPSPARREVAPGLGHSDAAHAFAARTRLPHVGAPSPARREVTPDLGHSDAAHAFAAGTRLPHVGAPSPARREVAPDLGHSGAAHAFAAGTTAWMQEVEQRREQLPTRLPQGSVPTILRVAVPAFPRISNHTDFDPLRLHPQVDLTFVGPDEPLPACDLIILPGSKSVRADLAFLRAQDWDAALLRHLRYGGKVLGICGGFQMLGTTLADPHGIEGPAGASEGLGLLEIATELHPEKQLRNVTGTLAFADEAVSGYEIHAGISSGPGLARPFAHLSHHDDGAISPDGQVMGTYLHGLFEQPAACDALLRWAGLAAPATPDYHARREADLERLADAVEQHLDLDRILRIAGAASARR